MASCAPRSAGIVVLLLISDVIGVVLGQRCTEIGCCFNSDETLMTCRFTKPNVNVLLRGTSYLEDARITVGRKVSLNGDAVATNDNLRSLLFSDIDTLTLNGNTKVQVRENRDVSLTVVRVAEVNLNSAALQGWQSELATLSIADAENVQIGRNSFPKDTLFRRVRLSNITYLTLNVEAISGTIERLELENIRSLRLHPLAISGDIAVLSLQDVSVGSCPPLAISGSIDTVSLRSMAVSGIEWRCLDATSGWQSLTIAESALGQISPRGIYGSIGNISISDCRLLSAGPGALSVVVTRLNMTNTSVGELAPRALQVEATSAVLLHQLNVSYLRSGALRDLQVIDAIGFGVTVSRLVVRRVEPGSLAFAGGAPVMLKDLLLASGCVCSTPSWARQLLLGSSSPSEESTPGARSDIPSSSGLTEEHLGLLQQIEAGLCTMDGDSISLADFTATHCGDSITAGGVGGQQTGSSTPLADWWSYLGVAALAALLLVAAVLLAIAVVRCRRRRLKRRSGRLEWPGPAGAGKHSLCSERQPADGDEQREAGCRLVLSADTSDRQPQALYSQPEELYSEVQEQDLPAEGSRREPLYANSVGTEGPCCCPAEGSVTLVDVPAPTGGCGCGAVRLSAPVDPVYANMPGGDRRAGNSPAERDDAHQLSNNPSTEVADRISGGPTDQTDYAPAAKHAEDLPDYVEIDSTPAACPEELPDYVEISPTPAMCPEKLPDCAELGSTQELCPDEPPDYDEVGPTPAVCPKEPPVYAEITVEPPTSVKTGELNGSDTEVRMVENELYSSSVGAE